MLIELNGRQIKKDQRYPNANYDLMIKVQDRVLERSNVVISPNTSDTVLVKDEETDKFIYLFLYLFLSHY